MRVSPAPERPPVHMAPAPGAGPAFERLSKDRLPQVRIAGEIRHKRLQCVGLLFERAPPPQFGHPPADDRALPALEGLRADAQRAAALGHGCAGLDLAESLRDRRLGKG